RAAAAGPQAPAALPAQRLLAAQPLPKLQHDKLDLKHLLPFRLNGSSPLSLFPNFNTMDPVQKAVINHTFGVPQPLKKKQIISCNICHLRFNSTNQAEAHYKGHKHTRKLKAIEAQKNRQRRAGLHSDLEPSSLDIKIAESPRSSAMLTPVSDVSAGELAALSPVQVSPSSQLSEGASDSGGPEATDAADAAEAGLSGRADTSSADGEPQTDEDAKKSKAHLHCPVCKVTMNSSSQLEAHNSGTKHKMMLEGQTVLPRRRGRMAAARASYKSKRLASKGSLSVSSKSFQCELCEIFVNSETQLTQHMNSRRHKDRMAGKPPKPKFTPHSKSQQTSLAVSITDPTKLALQKQLTKSLTTGFLPNPLAPPTLCAVAANPLALRHPMGAASAAFIQTPFLGSALFRPAPGPLRPAHAPIIFSPY
uniref:Zinc finger protein 385C n=1 Tax=Hippocampus comes TaxID=109280 RepID=A0A3Q2YM68_HIPCM